MFHHVKELQFNARVSEPDPRFARMLLEQFGGANGELKAMMQYFVQAFSAKKPYPKHYDMLMDIATEEFSHLEIVGATITMLLNGINGELKNAEENFDWYNIVKNGSQREQMIHEHFTSPSFLVHSGGGPTVTDCNGHPWSGFFVNANGDLTVDLRSDIAAESRAKITYEYLLQFTDDPLVKESLRFLMTREIAHFQMFSAALESIEPNFPPAILQGDPRYTHVYYNSSEDKSDSRGPWNEGQGPWLEGEQWVYVEDPVTQTRKTEGQLKQPVEGTDKTEKDVKAMNKKLGNVRSEEVKAATKSNGPVQWSEYTKK
ncbi:MAG: manganese catalase family protein [bacterium]|jgi:Mn-containing catalase